ncbi:MAG: hypothetical protein KA085_13815 [Phenylobacterium sp.]|jgi:hypothetical protein|uniref:hypothetical protein n=1 Tax=Phenylobacterium sp. TaxID=1871053 RepID=UPI001B45FE6C|nr:hypothetical protein [Phenylobacterium sp.]MBP7648795.1 hypothetical protein [Phenylobacterium sp.]MBP7817202.1 hypothetical protein [Phenylobacterium sp.]MBP9755108.1 hypothetical protein [Phenylobacterium sp.]
MPLNMLFRLLGLILVVLGLINVAIGFLPASVLASIPKQLMLVEGFAQSVSLLGLGAMIYLLAEIAAKRPAKSY